MEANRVSCVSCTNLILPDTAARNGGLCGVCERKRAKLAATAAAEAASQSDPNLEPWLEPHLLAIEARLAEDLQRHMSVLFNGKIDFYGYAILAEDYGTITYDDPPSIAIAYNCESDIAEGNEGSVYYRYSPDEWENYVHTGFDDTNLALRTLHTNFLRQFYVDSEDRLSNNNRSTFFDSVHRTYLRALKRAKATGIFSPGVFLVIWISDSSYTIINESARILNSPEVFKTYASEFVEDGG